MKHDILSYLDKKHGVQNLDPASLVILPGLVVALNVVSKMAADMKKSVMTATPIYPPFMTSSFNQGSKLVTVPLIYNIDKRDYSLDLELMEKLIKRDLVGMFLLCNPHNPVGKVFSRKELQALADLCIRYNVIVCSDEIHCDLILNPDSCEHVSFLSISGAMERTIVLHAPSKTFNIAGLAAAFAVIPNATLRAKFKRECLGDVNVFGYIALKTAYEDRDGTLEVWKEELRNYLRINVDIVRSFVAQVDPLLKFEHRHDATYLIWIDARELKKQVDTNVQKWLEVNAKVGLNDGSLFGPAGVYDGYVRLNVGCSKATLEKALQQLDFAIRKLM